MSRSGFFDLKSLFGFRKLLAELGTTEVPRAVLIGEPSSISHGRVGILPGSFNPATTAHLDLALAARERFKLDFVVFSLSSVIIDKERVVGLCQEDRLLLLSLLAHPSWMGVAVVNRGLYYEQVVGFRALFGKDAHIYFIVGMDKVVQIFDEKYYTDRDAALRTLFFEAQLIAANRGEWGEEALHSLLERDDNQAYEGRVYPLTLSPNLKDLSSTKIRKAVQDHAPFEHAVPGAVSEFIAETHTYREPYTIRVAALQALCRLGRWAEQAVDLERVVARAQGGDPDGESLRAMLCQESASSRGLKDLLIRLGLCRS